LGEIRRCLKAGANPSMVTPDGWVREEMRTKNRDVGRTLLHHAAYIGNFEIFKFIVDSGADIDRKRNTAWRPNGGVSGRGSTCLHHAVMYNRE
jgi:ankyrin repeat protein